MTDKEFLAWIHERLEYVYHEDPHMDFMHKLRAIVLSMQPDIRTVDVGSGNNSADMRMLMAKAGDDRPMGIAIATKEIGHVLSKRLRGVAVPLQRLVGPPVFRWVWGRYLNYRHKAWDQHHAAMDVREWLCWHVDQKTKHNNIVGTE